MHLLLRLPASGGQSFCFKRWRGFRERPEDGMGTGRRREKPAFLRPVRECSRFVCFTRIPVSPGTIVPPKNADVARKEPGKRFPSLYSRVRVPSPAPEKQVERRPLWAALVFSASCAQSTEGRSPVSITVNIYYHGADGSARRFAEEMTASGTVDAIRAERRAG